MDNIEQIEEPKKSFREFLQRIFGEHEPSKHKLLSLREVIKNQTELTEEQKIAIEEYSSLKHLCLGDIGLKSMINFPVLPMLTILDVGDNRLEGKDIEKVVELYPRLETLKIENNMIESTDEFKALEGEKIMKLVLEGNPLSRNDKEYKKKLFEMIPGLVVIDKEDKIGEYVYSSISSCQESSVCEELEENEMEMEEVEDEENGENEEEDNNDDNNDDNNNESESNDEKIDDDNNEEEEKNDNDNDKYLQRKHMNYDKNKDEIKPNKKSKQL